VKYRNYVNNNFKRIAFNVCKRTNIYSYSGWLFVGSTAHNATPILVHVMEDSVTSAIFGYFVTDNQFQIIETQLNDTAQPVTGLAHARHKRGRPQTNKVVTVPIESASARYIELAILVDPATMNMIQKHIASTKMPKLALIDELKTAVQLTNKVSWGRQRLSLTPLAHTLIMYPLLLIPYPVSRMPYFWAE
jgi:hypothetical protein